MIRHVERSIPACAGEPVDQSLFNKEPGVYPRVCGGTGPVSAQFLACRGLSPRVRGNPLDRDLRPLSVRSIPACAGEPGSPTLQNLEIKVYPRVCGGTAEKQPANPDS